MSFSLRSRGNLWGNKRLLLQRTSKIILRYTNEFKSLLLRKYQFCSLSFSVSWDYSRWSTCFLRILIVYSKGLTSDFSSLDISKGVCIALETILWCSTRLETCLRVHRNLSVSFAYSYITKSILFASSCINVLLYLYSATVVLKWDLSIIFVTTCFALYEPFSLNWNSSVVFSRGVLHTYIYICIHRWVKAA